MTTHEAKAFWVTGPAKGEIRAAKLPTPSDDELLIETLYTAISRGTEALVFQGRVPVSEYERMRAPYQAGDFPAPVKYGYANVGRVLEGRRELVGQTVFTLFPHQTRFVVPASAATIVPDAVPAARAVLAAYLETAVNGLWDALPAIGDRITVIGAGTLGCLSAWLASRIPGAQVELVDIDPSKQQAAAALGVNFRHPGEASRGVDVLIHTSGAASGLQTALQLAGFEATLIELSWYGSTRVELPLGEQFHSQRLTLRSSQVAHIAAAQRPRWDHKRRMELVMRLLEANELDALFSGESSFAELPQVLARLSSAGQAAICHRIKYL
jgi:2-desacetyl-2-hydroxyethyl bacteriochlorophyllide A dehydrogenase